MARDFRLQPGFFTHPKTVKLQRKLGSDGVLCLLRLWGHAAENRPTGDLSGMDDTDIAIASAWQGPSDPTFVACLVEIRWLDGKNRNYQIHDWKHWQAWLSHAPEREASARHAASMRWACGGHARGNAPSPIPTPDPSPDPSPTPTPRAEEPRSARPRRKAASEISQPDPFVAFKDWAYSAWIRSGGEGQWNASHWTALHRGFKVINGSARRSWEGYLADSTAFYAGHYPLKWASEPARWLPSAEKKFHHADGVVAWLKNQGDIPQ